MRETQVVEVVVDLKAKALDRTFDYVVPEAIVTQVQPGHRVFVSFGKQHCQAFVVGVREESTVPSRLKPILAVLDKEPILTADMLTLCHWLCGRYVCTRLEAIHAVLPGAFKTEHFKQYAVIAQQPPSLSQEQQRVWTALAASPRTYEQMVSGYGPNALMYLEQWMAQGFVHEVVGRKDRVASKTTHVVHLSISHSQVSSEVAARQNKAPKQAALLRALQEHSGTRLDELGLQPSHPTVKALCKQGLIELEEVEVLRAPVAATEEVSSGERVLTVWQERALRDITEGMERTSHHHFLLHGVTGSGKTEVYLQAIGFCLKQGFGAIVLVPEISLTPQMVGRFTARFGSQVAVLHSGLSLGEKRDEWTRIRRGEASIVVGARSAVFAPVRGLKLLIVDEEHESSYKQEETPRYEAREVARWRMDQVGGVTVFGSATPSLQSMRDAELGKAQIVQLPNRVNGQSLPPVAVVDMRDELKQGNRGLFSTALQQGLEDAITSGHQAILFLNRRGFAAFVLCRNCGEAMQCSHCDITLTLHKGRHGEWLKCHYCNDTEILPEVCPKCREAALRPFGVGTQQVEQTVRETWPQWRVLRMDVDTTRRKGSHQAAFDAFGKQEADVLIGTQMVAKGLDFPNVQFVGVIAADTMLSVPDYRSAERTFSLLTQVAGRAGRAQVPGHTVIQTYRPEHYAISAAATHDYSTFYRQEREMREAFGYPPFCELTVFMATHAEANLAQGAARRFEREMRKLTGVEQLVVLPAVPSGIRRMDDRYRFQVVVKYSRWSDVCDIMVHAFQTVRHKMTQLGGTCVLDVNAGRI
jgi:primosomal protein N' (replication factor Y) (superfamily II helicase)